MTCHPILLEVLGCRPHEAVLPHSWFRNGQTDKTIYPFGFTGDLVLENDIVYTFRHSVNNTVFSDLGVAIVYEIP